MNDLQQGDKQTIEAAKRKVRLISILDAADAAGLTPVPVSTLHMIAYFADVLAPVWQLPVLDSVVLKQIRRPFFPRLQADLDRLVGTGVVNATRVAYQLTESSETRMDADYELNRSFANPILREIGRYKQQADGLEFVREVVYAVSAFGVNGISDLGSADAAYSNPLVDVGGLIDVEDAEEPNPSARVALRFRELNQSTTRLTDAEIVHLYVRHLYLRMNVA